MWFNSISRVLDYIEEHLSAEIRLDEIARISCMSEFNFQKIFSILTDLPLGEYIRRRKLSKSLYDLLETDRTILEIALKYGYESAESYTRRFRAYFHKTPAQARKDPRGLFAFPRLTLSLTIKGAEQMKYQIVEQDAFRVVGVKRSYESVEEGFEDIPSFWEEFNFSSQNEHLWSMRDGRVPGYLGLCVGHTSGTGFDYHICVSSGAPAGEGFEEHVVPSSRWLVFDAVGAVPKSVQTVNRQIYENFLPGSQYRHAGTEEFELYGLGDPKADDYLTQIWIPVLAGPELDS